MRSSYLFVLGLLGIALGLPVTENGQIKENVPLTIHGDVKQASKVDNCNDPSSSRRCFEITEFSIKDKGPISPIEVNEQAEEDFVFVVSEEGESQEENLVPDLPPSNKARNWKLAICLVTLSSLGCLLYIYRHTITQHPAVHEIGSTCSTYLSIISSKLPRIPLNIGIPTISSSTFSLSKSPYSSTKSLSRSQQFRPDSTTLLQWTEDQDPAFFMDSSGPSSGPIRTPKSSWRSKIPNMLVGKQKGKKNGSVLFGDEVDEEGLGYEEVGLLPSPRNGILSTIPTRKNYGTL